MTDAADAPAHTIPYADLTEWRRSAHELRVLLGAIASMAAPNASRELKETIQLARAISDELRNDMEVAV